MEFNENLCECKYCGNEDCCEKFAASRKAGIKEVVDWIKSQRITPLPNKPSKGITFFSNVEFQNKIKEWGLE